MSESASPSIPRRAVAALLPVAACVVQWLCWPVIVPFVWFLFYPTVFLSSWLGGYASGVAATFLSTGLVWWFFMAPVHTLLKPRPGAYINAAAFIGMGFLFSYFHERLHRARHEAAEARFRALFEQAGVGVVEAEAASGRFVRVNGRFCEILGHTEAELLGMRFQDVTHPGDVDRDVAETRRLAAGEIPGFATEKRYIRKDGATVWAALTVRPLLWPGLEDKHLVAIIEDISARRCAEEEVRLLNATLERRVAERTQELQAANQELESFAYAVSHDLRAPLRAMDGFSRALLEDCAPALDAEGRGYLDQIILASHTMAGLIDGLLLLSRATRGELERVPVDVSALAVGVLEGLRKADGARPPRWRVEPGIRAEGDPRMLRAAFANLLGNAWKYSGKAADPLIEVDRVQEDGRDWIRIRDNGCGFDMAFADKLWKPFQRLHRQDEYPGLGIGLATTQRIVNRHGGSLRAESAPGRGATFLVALPSAASQESP